MSTTSDIVTGPWYYLLNHILLLISSFHKTPNTSLNSYMSCTTYCDHLAPSFLHILVLLIPSLGVPLHVASQGSHLKPPVTRNKGIERKRQKIKGLGQGFVNSQIWILLRQMTVTPCTTQGQCSLKENFRFSRFGKREIFHIMLSRCCICGVIQSIEQFTSLCGRMRVLKRWKYTACQGEACMNNIISLK